MRGGYKDRPPIVHAVVTLLSNVSRSTFELRTYSDSAHMSHFVVTGPVAGQIEGAAAPNRLEINDFVKNEEMFSLYIQALGEVFGIFRAARSR